LGPLNFALVALAVTGISIAVTASALNAIATAQIETEPQEGVSGGASAGGMTYAEWEHYGFCQP
jgi:hypothetical protein